MAGPFRPSHPRALCVRIGRGGGRVPQDLLWPGGGPAPGPLGLPQVHRHLRRRRQAVRGAPASAARRAWVGRGAARRPAALRAVPIVTAAGHVPAGAAGRPVPRAPARSDWRSEALVSARDRVKSAVGSVIPILPRCLSSCSSRGPAFLPCIPTSYPPTYVHFSFPPSPFPSLFVSDCAFACAYETGQNRL